MRGVMRALSRLHFVAVIVAVPSIAWFVRFSFDRPAFERTIGSVTAFVGIATAILLWRAHAGGARLFLAWAALIALGAVLPAPDFELLDATAILLVFALLIVLYLDVRRSLAEVARVNAH